MKPKSKIKNIILGLCGGILAFSNKVFASSLQTPMMEPEYGVQLPYSNKIFLLLKETFFIPIIIMVGLIVYLKKSKRSKKIKILIATVIVIIIILAYFLIALYCS